VKPQDELSLFSQSDPSHFRHEISGRFVAANFGNFMMYTAASFRVMSGLPFGGWIGSSKRRDHGIPEPYQPRERSCNAVTVSERGLSAGQRLS
jgi:hypothetical protein